MNFLRLCSFLVFLFYTCHAKSFYTSSVNADSDPFAKEYKAKFLKNVNILNKLQAQLSNSSYIPEEITAESFEDNGRHDPMENPYLFEGDIILTDDQWDILIENAREELRARGNSGNESVTEIPKKRAMESDAKRWTLPIPFYIEPALNANANLILSVIRMYEAETCIRFERHSEPISDSNSLEFIKDVGCYSGLGMTGGKIKISIGNGCEYTGTVWHEIAHALGVVHEQSRSDRDDHVIINLENVEGSKKHNFKKHTVDTYGIPYDYGSVMHYGMYAFTMNRKPTIITRDRTYTSTIGTLLGPSFYDIKGINSAYCSSTCKNTLKCLNGGYINPSNCQSCNCPLGFSGRLCGVMVNNAAGCGSVARPATPNIQKLTVSGSKTCYFLITAPPLLKVYFKIKNISLYMSPNGPCLGGYVEINHTGDFKKSGARFCVHDQQLPIDLSVGNQLMVIYRPRGEGFLSMEYRIGY